MGAKVVLSLLLLMAAAAARAAPTKDPAVWEISTRPWLYQLAQRYPELARGRSQYLLLRDVPKAEWQAIKDDHMDVVWLMGVWSLGAYGLQHDQTDAGLLAAYKQELPSFTLDDVIGSPYAITNYTVNPQIGTEDDLAAVRALLNGMGMRLMVDMVPNHMAVDSVLGSQSPGCFVQKPASGSYPSSWWIARNGNTFAYGRDPYDGAWTDTLQLNYWNQVTRTAMTNVLMHAARVADMVRVDMAMLVLNDVISHTWGSVMAANGFNQPSSEFWGDAIRAVKGEFPSFKVMGEAYNYGITNPPEKQLLQQLGFDYVYDKTVLDLLKANNLDNLRGYISSSSQQFYSGTAHFVENHDEPRAAAALGGQQQAFAGSAVASALPGLKLYYFGQFDGLSAKLDVHLRRATSQTPNATLHAQYTKLMSVLADDVFHTGTWTDISVPKTGTGWRLVAWRWSSSDGSDKRLCVINFSNQQGWGNVVVADAQSRNNSDNITVTELLSGTSYTRSASTMRSSGLTVGVPAYSAQIFSY